jgi:ribonuclease HI
VPVTLELVEEIINSTNDSSPGPDTIPFAAYRAVVEVAAPVFLDMIRGIMKGDPSPAGFNAGILHLLPKKVTDRIEDTRPLVVNNTDNRIVASIILASIAPALEEIFSEDQNGFRPNRSTTTNIDFFNEKFYSALENNKYYDILFIDFLKAFDSVAHTAIFKLLEAVGLPAEYVTGIKELFRDAHCFTNFKSRVPERINFESGVKQGCPLSPTLFILIADVLIDMLKKVAKVDVKFFADDGAIGAENIIPRLRHIKTCFEVFRVYTGLEMNVSKSACIATAGRAALRAALNRVGWYQLRISGKERYLGVYMGHETNLDDNFRDPYNKLLVRMSTLSPIKGRYSLQSRVVIWNTWCISVFSYVWGFYSTPTCYVNLIDSICVKWLGHANTMKTLYLSRPTKLGGLTTPLKDATLANYSRLAAQAYRLPPNPESTDWSTRISSHRVWALKFLVSEYGIDVGQEPCSSTLYSLANNSSAMTTNYRTYLDVKLQKAGLNELQKEVYFANYRILHSWVPSYARVTSISLAHNALLTAKRLNKTETCYLCGIAVDGSSHIWGQCPTVQQAHSQYWALLGTNRAFNFLTAIAANWYTDAPTATAQLMFTVWRARCSAYHGMQRDYAGWSNWIVLNTLKRIHTSSPGFFQKFYKDSAVPCRYKIVARGNFGSSKHSTKETREAARYAVESMINALPCGTMIAFTDGSAKPNPGPAGAGAIIYTKAPDCLPAPKLVSYSAAIGIEDNNAGELYAVGMVIEHAKLTLHTGEIAVFTDSGIVKGALASGASAGKENQALLRATRSRMRALHACKMSFYWVPGHSGIELNEAADALANAGAEFSASNYASRLDLSNTVKQLGYFDLMVNSDHEPPD